MHDFLKGYNNVDREQLQEENINLKKNCNDLKQENIIVKT